MLYMVSTIFEKGIDQLVNLRSFSARQGSESDQSAWPEVGCKIVPRKSMVSLGTSSFYHNQNNLIDFGNVRVRME